MDLPNTLRVALERELHGHAATLPREAAALSKHYRGGEPAPRGSAAARAYAATRMPATFAATAAAMAAITVGLPGFAPRTLFDAGAGTGATLWAAAATWPSLASATLIERDEGMATLGRRLAAAGGPSIAGAQWRAVDLIGPWQAPGHDLVTMAYALGELGPAARSSLVARLWACATQTLLLVEPGTPEGWAVIRAAREQLRAAGASIVAPCPHNEICPLPADDWCHFAQRLARTRTHRAAKGGALGYEDEKYAYVAVTRTPGEPVTARVLRHPLTRPGRIELTLCTREGLQQLLVTRGDRARWHVARRLKWGDGVPPDTFREYGPNH